MAAGLLLIRITAPLPTIIEPPAAPVVVAPAVAPQPLPDEKKYVYVDLTAMTLRMYQDGAYTEIPVLSIRRIGSKFDTPTGLFKIGTRETEHFSSIGHVYMGYSMQFDGDYFIHGWPRYPDGTPVPKSYSGGCIRLSDEGAKQVYDFVDVGTPVLVAAPVQ